MRRTGGSRDRSVRVSKRTVCADGGEAVTRGRTTSKESFELSRSIVITANQLSLWRREMYSLPDV